MPLQGACFEKIAECLKLQMIQRALLTKYKLQVEREEVEQEIAMREEKLKGSEDADVGQVFTTLGEKKQNLADMEERIRSAEEEVKKAEKLLDSLRKAGIKDAAIIGEVTGEPAGAVTVR